MFIEGFPLSGDIALLLQQIIIGIVITPAIGTLITCGKFSQHVRLFCIETCCSIIELILFRIKGVHQSRPLICGHLINKRRVFHDLIRKTSHLLG